MEENLYAPPTALVADILPTRDDGDVIFFPVSPLKLVVLSTCTLGFYQIYWFYKQWVLVRDRSEPHIIPWARALFCVFWCYRLFEFIRQEEQRLGINSTLPAGPWAAGWIVFSLLSRLPQPYALLTFFAPLFLIPVQQRINQINAQVAPDHDRNARFRDWNWLALVLGGLLWALIAIGLVARMRR